MADQQTIQHFTNLILKTATKQGVPVSVAKNMAGQAAHETANFSSNVLKKNNNLFGMKLPSVRKSPFIQGAGTQPPAIEGSTPYASYSSPENSVKDLIHWFQYQKINYDQVKTPEAYAAWLKSKGYYGPTAEFYGRQIRIFVDKMKDFIQAKPAAMLLLIAGASLIGLGIYFFIKRKSG